MNWFIAVAAYVVIWWITIFAVLPFGVKLSDEGDPGRAAGAPAHPRLKLKVIVTSLIAAVLWLALYWAVKAGVMNFRGST
jgi:predicted secreted protein